MQLDKKTVCRSRAARGRECDSPQPGSFELRLNTQSFHIFHDAHPRGKCFEIVRRLRKSTDLISGERDILPVRFPVSYTYSCIPSQEAATKPNRWERIRTARCRSVNTLLWLHWRSKR